MTMRLQILNSFSHELQKLAIEKHKKERIGSLAAVLPADLAGNLASRGAIRLREYTNKPVSFNEAVSAINKADPKKSIKAVVGEFTGAVPHSGEAGGFVFPSKNKHVVSLKPNAGLADVLHEVGHTKVHQAIGPKLSNKVMRYRNLLERQNRFGTNLYQGLGAGAALGSALSEDPSWTPTAISAGLASPILLDEIAATGIGARHLLKQKGLRAAASGVLKSNLPGLASYAAPVVLAPAAITLGRKLYRKYSKKNSNER